MKSLVPCPSCHRHVRASESACPFCHADLPDSLGETAVPGASQRMKRAAAFAFTASLAVAGCGPASSPTPGDASTADRATMNDGAPNDDGAIMALYGVPSDVPITPPDAARPDGATSDVARTDTGPRDDGSVMALYGVPADVAQVDDADQPDAGPSDDGSVMALYGAVPSDLGDTGGGGVRYGAPPPNDMV